MALLPLTVGSDTEWTERESQAIIARAVIATQPRRMSRMEVAFKTVALAKPTNARRIIVLERYQSNAAAEVFAANHTHLELAIACTTTQLESNGKNIYGSDPVSSWMEHWWGQPVTGGPRGNYPQVRRAIDDGYASNGIGVKQLTYPPLQRNADVRGGCWVPEHNCVEGDAFFLSLLKLAGTVWGAFYHYNGAGAAAVHYANAAVMLAAQWRARLS